MSRWNGPNAKQARPVVRACRVEACPWAEPQPARSAYPAMGYNSGNGKPPIDARFGRRRCLHAVTVPFCNTLGCASLLPRLIALAFPAGHMVTWSDALSADRWRADRWRAGRCVGHWRPQHEPGPLFRSRSGWQNNSVGGELRPRSAESEAHDHRDRAEGGLDPRVGRGSAGHIFSQ